MSWVILLYFLTLADLRWSAPWLPVLPLTLLPALALSLPASMALILAFFAGVLRDGLFPQSPWISPLLFLLVVWIGIKAREHLNLSPGIPRVFTLFLLGVLASGVFLLLKGAGLDLGRILATGTAAALLGFPRRT